MVVDITPDSLKISESALRPDLADREGWAAIGIIALHGSHVGWLLLKAGIWVPSKRSSRASPALEYLLSLSPGVRRISDNALDIDPQPATLQDLRERRLKWSSDTLEIRWLTDSAFDRALSTGRFSAEPT